MADHIPRTGGLTTQSVRVVVIGGGIVGVSVLYWLTKLGWTDVVLLERSDLTAGSTWHAAGNVTTFHGLYELTRIQKASMELYRALDEETGGAVGLRRLGCLFLAHHDDQMDEYRMQIGRSKLLNLGYELLSPQEACDLHPLMVGDGLIGALYDPSYGPIDPTGTTNALAAAARRAGATVMRRTPVTDLTQRGDGGWDVMTHDGVVHADIVVNAAGFWGAEVAAMAGVRLPIIAVEHQYLVTEAIPAITAIDKPLPAIRGGDASYYMRREGDGLLVGAWEGDARVWGVDGIPRDFGAELLPSDLERIEGEIQAASERVPVLAAAGIKRIVNGPFAFGPDAKPHLGLMRGVRNFYSATGFTAGIAQGGGAGQVLAELIVEGQPSIDLNALDADRFGAYATRDYTVAKVQECYALRFAPSYPEEERPAGRPAKASPLYERLKSDGAVYGALRGWERPMWFAPEGVEPRDRPSFRRPNWFGPVGEECRAVRSAAGLLDLSSFAKYRVTGGGAEDWLNGLFAKPVPRRCGGIGLRLMLNPAGGVIGDFTVARIADDDFYVIGAAAAEHYHTRWFESALLANGVRFEPVTSRYGVLALAGPRARDILTAVTRDDISNEALPFFGVKEIEIASTRVMVLRVAFTGELGYELHAPVEALLDVYEALRWDGAEFGLINFGFRAMNCLRLEKSYRRLGSDLTAETTPLEAGMDTFVDLEDSDFIGREALLRQRDSGIRRRLVTLEVGETDADVIGNEPVFAGDRLAGFVTSGGYGHTVGRSLALAYVEADLAQTGTEFSIEILAERRGARIVPDSVYDPNGERLRG